MTEQLTHVTIVEKGVHELQPGEMTTHPDNQCWYIGCLGSDCGPGNLCGHTVTKSDTDITVSPSIVCLRCGAHYFVEHNQIRWV